MTVPNGIEMDDPEPLGATVAAVARRTYSNGSSVASSSNSTSLRHSSKGTAGELSRASFAKAMAHLTAMKRTADLTPIQVQTWHGALGGFAPQIVNAAVLEMALTDVRFPELGDLYQLCRAKAIKAGHIVEPYNPTGQPKKSEITTAEIRDIAGRLGLDVL